MGKATLKGAKKATKYRARDANPVEKFDKSKSRFDSSKLQTYEDTMGGDEDQFHLNRDEMSLDHNGYEQNGDDSLDEPDEIYDLNLPSRHNSNSSDEEDHETPSERYERQRLERQQVAQTKKERLMEKRERQNERFREKKELEKSKGRFGHEYDPKQDVVFDSGSDNDDEEEEDGSDEEEGTGRGELKSMEGGEDSDEEDDEKEDEEGSDSEEDRWAAGHYHVSRRAPGEADSEDEEALELEAEEARRLQRKTVERLRGTDFGFGDEEDEDDEEGGEKGKGKRLNLDDDDEGGQEKEQEESKIDTQSLSTEESIAHLLKYSPETLALVDDFVRTASKIKDVEEDLESIRKEGDGQGGEHPGLAILELEHQALTTYLPTLAFYFSLLLSPTPQPQSLLSRILTRLSSLRQSLATMEELDLTSATYREGMEGSDDDDEEDDASAEGEEYDDGSMLASEMFDFHNRLKQDEQDDDDSEGDEEEDEDEEGITESMLEGIDDDELEEIMNEVDPNEGAEGLMRRVRQRQLEKGILVEDDEDDSEDDEDESMDGEEEEEEEESIRPTKKPRSSAPIIPTLAPLSSSRKPQQRSTSTASRTSDYLDPSTLSHGDLADKTSSRHSLRFHVSQVAQKAQRRERLATRVGGDDDVPRRSKEQARREVLKKQQHGAAAKDEEGLDGGDWDEEDKKAAKAVRGSAKNDDDEGGGDDDDDDYYDLVKMEKDEGRKSKKAKYDEDKLAEKAEIEALSASMADGPRGATRQILANKGLTPRRKKENRNARVKKRLRYDKAQKKLSSMKATYKGGESRGGYEGEGSGIARKTVKSRRLG